MRRIWDATTRRGGNPKRPRRGYATALQEVGV